MIYCQQCGYTFKVTDDRVKTRAQGADVEGADILICCPRCKGEMFFEFCKVITANDIER